MEIDNNIKQNDYSNVPYSNVFKKSYALLGKTTLILAIALIVTAGLTIGLPFLYQLAGWVTLSDSHVITGLTGDGANAILIITIVCGIIALIDVLLSGYFIFKAKKTAIALIPFIIFVLAMSGTLSVFCLFFDWYTIGLAFGSTALSFIGVGAIGYLSKGKLHWAFILMSCLMIGAIPLIIVNIFTRSPIIYWLIEFAFLLIIYIFIFVDFRMLKEFVESGETSNQVAIYCAFNLYYDFIYVFIYLLKIIAKLRSN